MTIKEARQQANLTQQQMADIFEIPKRTIENWETGSRKCPSYVEKLIIEKLEGLKMKNEDYSKLTEVTTKEDINENEMYYSSEYEKHGNNHLYFYKFYDSNFNETRTVNVKYTNAIDNMVRIVRVEQKNDLYLAAYNLIPINEKFLKVEKTEDTLIELEAISKSVKPKGWK